jgi:hypothetical protein
VGLDVYVGTLTRYLVGDWELVTQRFAREVGLTLEVVRSEPEPEDAIKDPDVVREAVLEWREALGRAIGADLSWSEADAMPYFTDKPDWRGYLGLLLLAAHDEHPEIPMPDDVPERVHDHPLLRSVMGRRPRRLFRRAASSGMPRYFALYTPELWLPADLEAVWKGSFVNGVELTMSSTLLLRAQLQELASRLGASEEQLAQWRESAGAGGVVGTIELGSHALEQLEPGSAANEGRFGLAVMLELVERAVEHTLPLKLDY